MSQAFQRLSADFTEPVPGTGRRLFSARISAICGKLEIENARTTGKPPEVVEAETAGIPAAAQIFFRDDFGFNMGKVL